MTRRRDTAPTVTSTRVNAVTQDVSDGLDTRRVITLRNGQRTATHRATVAAALTAWAQQQHAARAWTLDGYLGPVEQYWTAQPDDDLVALPLTRAAYRRAILGRIAWLRRIVDEGMPTSISVELVLIEALRLGVTIEDARWRFGRGGDVRKARKATVDQRRSVEKAAVLKREDGTRINRALAADVRRLRAKQPDASVIALANQLLPTYGKHSGNRPRDLDALRQRIARILRK